ncbi:nucleoside 2-deoxyribosyltransferase [Vibrio alginolyticus]|nr:nucleoside 2-deoxyribosyltransferase [Vibrio alginolyticus]
MLILGEIFIDYTLPSEHNSCKMRLGGIIHAARGLWANNIKYSAAIICPSYLTSEATNYLKCHGCDEVIVIGEVLGSPNIMSLVDQREVGQQGYEELLRDRKSIGFTQDTEKLTSFDNVILFPGRFCVKTLTDCFSPNAKFSIDVAYDISDLSVLSPITGKIETIYLSTSSDLFLSLAANDISSLLTEAQNLYPCSIVLKENRGGSRLFDLASDRIVSVPAILQKTVNSVGVGDVFTAVAAAYRFSSHSIEDAVWRGALSATYYSQTTFPDDFKRTVQRSHNTPLDKHKSIGGTSLSWHARKKYNIYIAAPDFSYIDRKHLDSAISSLEYHNFNIRRPVLENGELNEKSSNFERRKAYEDDCALINVCDVIFAIPLQRDPGTLVEVGIGLAKGIPVITYDPNRENDNNMVVTGSNKYSSDLDECLNHLYVELSYLENRK